MALSEKDKKRLDEFYLLCKKEKYHNIGYPENAEFDYSELFKFIEFSINNVGDPFAGSTYLLNSLSFEKEVIEFFSKLLKISPAESWGYVTNGGTEGNLYGVYLGRELYPDGILYYSSETHYSVEKIARILKLHSISIKTLENGEMDYIDLKEKIFFNKEKPAIIFANIGTTMKGAIDDLNKIKDIFSNLNIKEHYIHCDAALSGAILPFVEKSQPHNFSDGIDSIAISGHKFIGSPIPCGIVIAKKSNVDRISRIIDYIATPDKTITGSRNGFTPLIFWYAIKSIGEDGLRNRVNECFKKAEYAIKKFNSKGVNAWKNENSITVVFPKPSEKLWRKWCLANCGNCAHIITSHHVSYERIDELVQDITNTSSLIA